MMDELRKAGLKTLKTLHDNAIQNLDDFNNCDTDKLLKFGCSYESEDIEYRILLNMIRLEKHTCHDCVFNIDNKCAEANNLSLDKKIYCSDYKNIKSCKDCCIPNFYDDCIICNKYGKIIYYDEEGETNCPDWKP